jgi:hypothetical protein
MNRIALGASLCLLLSVTGTAFAESGVVTGRARFWQANGEYCPVETGRSCTGARYNQANFNQLGDVANVEVFVENDTVGRIGSGSTDSAGNYSVSWSYSGTVPNKDKTKLWWRLVHKDGHFKVHSTSGQYTPYSYTFTLKTGTTAIGSRSWGGNSLSTADGYINAYWALETAWRYAVGTVGVVHSRLNNLEVRGFADSIWQSCPTGCYLPGNNRIQLPLDGSFTPTKAMHELGHAAAYETNSNKVSATYQYCKNEIPSGDCGWGMEDDEWGAVSWQEAHAELNPLTALYAPSATQPYRCRRPKLSCLSSTDPNIETSTGATCSGTEKSWPLTMMRFIWDVYDSNDSVSLGGAADYWKIWQVWEEYGDGCGQHGINGPFGLPPVGVCLMGDYYTQPDTRASMSFAYQMNRVRGVDVTSARTSNCTLP